MKVCFYGYTIATKGSGARQYALDLGQWLVKEGNEVTFVTGKWGDRSSTYEGLKYDFVVTHESPAKKSVQFDFALRSLSYFLRHRQDFDLIHSLSSFPQFIRLAAWVRRVTGIPMVHSLLASTPPRSFFDSLEGFICISKGIRERFNSPRGIYIPPFIDVKRFDSSLRYDLGHLEDALIGTMGAPYHRKGIRYLVEAIPLVLERYPKVHFFLAIDLPGIQFMEETRREREYIDRFIEAHQLREKVDLLGHVNVPQFLKSLDLFVYAVQTTIGMIDIPPTLLECLAAGCGVVTSQKGGIGELIRDRYNGLLVGSGEHDRPQAYAERILELLNNRGLLKTLRDNGPRSIEEFDLERVGRKIFQFYQSILEQRRRGRG